MRQVQLRWLVGAIGLALWLGASLVWAAVAAWPTWSACLLGTAFLGSVGVLATVGVWAPDAPVVYCKAAPVAKRWPRRARPTGGRGRAMVLHTPVWSVPAGTRVG